MIRHNWILPNLLFGIRCSIEMDKMNSRPAAGGCAFQECTVSGQPTCRDLAMSTGRIHLFIFSSGEQITVIQTVAVHAIVASHKKQS